MITVYVDIIDVDMLTYIDVPGILDLVLRKDLGFLVARELNRQFCEDSLVTW